VFRCFGIEVLGISGEIGGDGRGAEGEAFERFSVRGMAGSYSVSVFWYWVLGISGEIGRVAERRGELMGLGRRSEAGFCRLTHKWDLLVFMKRRTLSYR